MQCAQLPAWPLQTSSQDQGPLSLLVLSCTPYLDINPA
jgi:hypothetical protein